MPYEIKSLEVESTDNIHTLKGKLYVPEGEIKGIVHIVHGMCEYIDRFSHILSFFAENGYAACGYDNLGHGETAANDKELGFFAHRDGWKYLVNDVFAFENAVKKIFPKKKIILMGHSMGSFIARIAAEYYPENISGLIICGTGGPNPAAPIGLLLTSVLKKIRGEKYISKLVDKIAFGAFNNGFEGTSKYNWLTKDAEIITKYENDKYCTFKFTVSAMHDLVTLNMVSNRKKWFLNLEKKLPVLIISGKDDPVGNHGKGVRKVYKYLADSGMSDVTLKIYENCRHEIHNDSCKDEMMRDLLHFTEKIVIEQI